MSAAADLTKLLIQPQVDWINDKADFKVCEKGRRTGMTWAEALDDVLIAAKAKKDGGQSVYYISYAKEMALEFIDTVAIWCRALNYFVGAIEIEHGEDEGLWKEGEEKKIIQTYTIKLPSGHRIVALSNRPRNLRGKQGVVVVDEAAFVDDLAGLLKAALALLIWGGKVRVISTHDGQQNEFAKLIEEMRAGKQRGSLHSVPFGLAVQHGLVQRICDRTGKPYSPEYASEFVSGIYHTYRANAAEELDCIPRDGSGAALMRSQLNAIAVKGVPVFRFDGLHLKNAGIDERLAYFKTIQEKLAPLLSSISEKTTKHLGYDVGRSSNLSCAWLLETLDLKTPCLACIELSNMPFDVQRMFVWWLMDVIPRLRGLAIDGRGIGLQLGEETWQRYGERILRVTQPGLTWARDHMPRYIVAAQDRTTTIPADDAVIEDALGVRLAKGIYHVPDIATGISPNGGERHGDAALAHAFALQAQALVNSGEIDFQSTGTRDNAIYPGARWDDQERGFGSVEGNLDFAGYM